MSPAHRTSSPWRPPSSVLHAPIESPSGIELGIQAYNCRSAVESAANTQSWTSVRKSFGEICTLVPMRLLNFQLWTVVLVGFHTPLAQKFVAVHGSPVLKKCKKSFADLRWQECLDVFGWNVAVDFWLAFGHSRVHESAKPDWFKALTKQV